MKRWTSSSHARTEKRIVWTDGRATNKSGIRSKNVSLDRLAKMLVKVLPGREATVVGNTAARQSEYPLEFNSGYAVAWNKTETGEYLAKNNTACKSRWYGEEKEAGKETRTRGRIDSREKKKKKKKKKKKEKLSRKRWLTGILNQPRLSVPSVRI